MGLYAGKGNTREEEHGRFLLMVDELVEWFGREIGRRCGGINCAEIADCPLAYAPDLPRCCSIIGSTWDKVGEILRENHIGLDGSG